MIRPRLLFRTHEDHTTTTRRINAIKRSAILSTFWKVSVQCHTGHCTATIFCLFLATKALLSIPSSSKSPTPLQHRLVHRSSLSFATLFANCEIRSNYIAVLLSSSSIALLLLLTLHIVVSSWSATSFHDSPYSYRPCFPHLLILLLRSASNSCHGCHGHKKGQRSDTTTPAPDWP